MSGPRTITLASVRKLKANRRNARTHSRKQVEQIAQSIRRFGWTYPLLVDEDGVVLAGGGRLEAAKKLDLKEIPVIAITDLSDAEKRALVLADNKIAANAGWDRKLLAAELGELAVLLPECNLNLDLDITGFEPAEIDILLGDRIDPEAEVPEESVKTENTAVARPGDLWRLGSHLLLCANATHASAYEKLMGNERAQMVFVDPPCTLRVSPIQGREFVNVSGEKTPGQVLDFSSKWMSLAAQYSIDGSIHYVCIDWRHLIEVSTAGSEVYDELKNVVVWNKTNAGPGSLYRSQHELIFVFKRGCVPHVNNVELGRHGRNRSNVWTYPGVNAFRAGQLDDLSEDPTVKPIALVTDAMRDCSRRGDIILDPFMGFGTTVMAAERVGRKAFGIEIDPLYVDATIRRWQNFTKKDAILAGSQITFDEASIRVVREHAHGDR